MNKGKKINRKNSNTEFENGDKLIDNSDTPIKKFNIAVFDIYNYIKKLICYLIIFS